MELLENIGFTDADISLLIKALDQTKEESKKPRIGAMLKELGIPKLPYGLPYFMQYELDQKEAAEKKEQEEFAEGIIDLQHKLLRFKKYLKQPSGPTVYPENVEPMGKETPADAPASTE